MHAGADVRCSVLRSARNSFMSVASSRFVLFRISFVPVAD